MSSSVKALAVASVLTLLYAGMTADLVREWLTRPAASHGILIPPMAAYLVWLRRQDLRRYAPEPDDRGLLLITGACALLLAGNLGAEMFLGRISLIFMIAGLVLTFWGKKRLRVLAFVIVLLATMIPVPTLVFNTLARPLQLVASYSATELAQLFGIAVHREGNVIQLADMTLGIAEACSGLNSLSTLLLTALLLNPSYRLTLAARGCLLLFTPPLAVAVNVLRVAGTAVLADSRPELALGFYHSFSGWVVFLIGFLILLGFATLLQRIAPAPVLQPDAFPCAPSH
jgi:exosortase